MSAPPPPSQGPPPTGLQRPPPQTQTERNLAKPLEDVYKNLALCAGPLMLGQSPSDLEMLLTPIESIDPVLGALMKNGVPAANLAPVEEKMIKRLTTVIAQTAFGNGSSRNEIFNNVVVNGTRRNGKLTIGQFMGLTPQRQLEVIDLGWTRVCLQKVYNKASSAMYEPTDVVIQDQDDPVPSGVVPSSTAVRVVDGGGKLRVGYLDEQNRPRAYTGLGVGFRVDGSGDGCDRDIARVKQFGMTTQLKNRYLMYNIKGWEVEGTVVDRDTSAPRVWRTKDDLFNESAVCISRNLYGATAFPTRELKDPAVLWATDISGLVGFDTEAHQLTLPNRNWRPGEKAYMWIPPARVIGYVRFEKLGCTGAGGWKFKIPANATWTFLPGWDPNAQPRPGPGSFAQASPLHSSQKVEYVVAQLEAWRGVEYEIAGTFDFAGR